MPVRKDDALKPGDTIGIIGGGQLGRMLAMAAARLGLKTVILEPGADCPAAQTATRHIAAAYDDEDSLREFSAACDVITYEFENIPVSAVSFLEENNLLFPSSLALEKSQDRLTEKNFLRELGIATAPYAPVEDLPSLQAAVETIGTPSILKTRRLGYDGKGQVRINKDTDLGEAWQAIGGVPAILEGFVGFSCEISVIAARDRNTRVVCYDPAENVHRQGILRTSTVPAVISPKTAMAATKAAEKITAALDYTGVMGIEFFVAEDGTLAVNEIAPRVHNSGHWTEAACDVSQFEQHVRAVAGLPLARPLRHSDCVMENLIGDDMDRVPKLLSDEKCMLHLYGKAETRKGRKMGHVTRLTGPAG
ncbi:5-(carboxyamino)imidazole ribonucleotide synthase [Salaquimonas pukyongi]|uniref:5-(carboxyamino)imidazole ribonucleotide synthase n=1 Tax=Salaquimonas pukyongi TaxID=2712698 RepID=UPI00096BA9D3|nr:5-(carboxyamino)imidazole ribonucleotide synthase [Salaquimonas pukyongi]